jgi:hypothetical protein
MTEAALGDAPGDAPGTAHGNAHGPLSPSPGPAKLDVAAEADFSPRKLKVMFGCLLGTLLGSHFLTVTAVAVVMAPMTSQFHWSRAGMSGAVSVLLFVGAIMTAVWGRLIDRFGVRRIVIGGTLAVGLVTASLSLSTSSLVQFYLCFAALGLFGSTAVGYSKIVGVLFTRNRGKALAIFGMESSLVGAISPQIIFQLEKHFGWRGMFTGLGVIVILVALLLIVLLDEVAAPAAKRSDGRKQAAVLEGMTIGQVRRTSSFWLLNHGWKHHRHGPPAPHGGPCDFPGHVGANGGDRPDRPHGGHTGRPVLRRRLSGPGQDRADRGALRRPGLHRRLGFGLGLAETRRQRRHPRGRGPPRFRQRRQAQHEHLFLHTLLRP